MKFNNLMNIFTVMLFAVCGVIYIVYGFQDFRYGIIAGVSILPPRLLFGLILELFAVWAAWRFVRKHKIL